MHEPMIQAKELHRQFPTADGPLPVLCGIDLSCQRGTMVAITGASGVGKSTLLHILGGLDRPTSGQVEVAGEKLTGKNEMELAAFRARHVGFVFQHHYLLEDFSALENLIVPQLVLGKSKEEAERQGKTLLERVGLGKRMSHLPSQLSGGEQQRVAVARALANRPSVLLADEPSGNLDTVTAESLHTLLSEVASADGVTMIIATHNADLASRCHMQTKLADGRLTIR